jgi:hypothetical protein
MKDLELMRVMVARDFAITTTAFNNNVIGRNRTVLSILADGEFKDRKKLAIPAMNAMKTCERILNTWFLIKFQRYWRLRNSYEKASLQRKVAEIDRKVLIFEPAYRFFQSSHDSARMVIDAIWNQPGSVKAMMGAEKEPEDAHRGMQLLASPERLESKQKLERMAEQKGDIEKDKPFKFPSFKEALELARLEVEKKQAPLIPIPIVANHVRSRKKTSPNNPEGKEPSKIEGKIQPALEEG